MISASVLKQRPGVALVVAVVVMASLTAILAVVSVQVFSQQQMIRQRHGQLQAAWLARAGVEMAAARLLEKPAPFEETQRDLLSDAIVRIVVTETDKDWYVVTTEAEVGIEDKPTVVRTASGRFHRTEEDGVIRLETVSP